MKHYFPISLLLSGLLMTAGCTSGRPHGAITSSPAPLAVTPDDNKVKVDVKFNVPANYISKRSRLFITPAYMVDDEIVKEFSPIVIDGPIYDKKLLRKAVLHGYIDPYAASIHPVLNTALPFSVGYDKTLSLPSGTKRGRIVAVVSNDGCGMCTGLDTIDVARVTGIPDFTFIPKRHDIEYPAFKVQPKIHEGNGEARLQFIVNKWDIVPSLADNEKELQKIVATLGPILTDSLATINSLNIFGSASAEASYKHNVMLAENRANSAKNWILNTLHLPKSVNNIIKIGARPEGWEPVVQAMIAANDPDSIKVRELMIKYPGPTDDAAEKYIRKLACWPRIRDKYLAKDRKVLYDYSWTIRNFTDDNEMIQIYKTRPDALSEDEFLHVAQLSDNDNSRLIVLEDLLRYFPENATARRHIGLIKSQRGEFEEALKYLLPEGGTDAAVCLIALGRDGEAASIMDRLSEETPDAEYVRALIAARAGNQADFSKHLAKAIADPDLRKAAVEEPDVQKFETDPVMKEIISNH